MPNQENDDQFAELKLKPWKRQSTLFATVKVLPMLGITMENKKIPLSAKGFEQAQSVAERFKIKPSKILVSEYLRTHQTAEPFCERNNSKYQAKRIFDNLT